MVKKAIKVWSLVLCSALLSSNTVAQVESYPLVDLLKAGDTSATIKFLDFENMDDVVLCVVDAKRGVDQLAEYGDVTEEFASLVADFYAANTPSLSVIAANKVREKLAYETRCVPYSEREPMEAMDAVVSLVEQGYAYPSGVLNLLKSKFNGTWQLMMSNKKVSIPLAIAAIVVGYHGVKVLLESQLNAYYQRRADSLDPRHGQTFLGGLLSIEEQRAFVPDRNVRGRTRGVKQSNGLKDLADKLANDYGMDKQLTRELMRNIRKNRPEDAKRIALTLGNSEEFEKEIPRLFKEAKATPDDGESDLEGPDEPILKKIGIEALNSINSRDDLHALGFLGAGNSRRLKAQAANWAIKHGGDHEIVRDLHVAVHSGNIDQATSKAIELIDIDPRNKKEVKEVRYILGSKMRGTGLTTKEDVYNWLVFVPAHGETGLSSKNKDANRDALAARIASDTNKDKEALINLLRRIGKGQRKRDAAIADLDKLGVPKDIAEEFLTSRGLPLVEEDSGSEGEEDPS